MIILGNKLGNIISYERFHQLLISPCVDIMQQITQDGVYIPEGISRDCVAPHVFVMDNLDWKKKTIEGGSFDATAIIIENPEDDTVPVIKPILVPPTTDRRKTIDQIPDEKSGDAYELTVKARLKGRSLQHITSVESLST